MCCAYHSESPADDGANFERGTATTRVEHRHLQTNKQSISNKQTNTCSSQVCKPWAKTEESLLGGLLICATGNIAFLIFSSVQRGLSSSTNILPEIIIH